MADRVQVNKVVCFTMDVESKGSEIRDSVVLKHKRVTQERVEKYLSATYFTDVNLRGRYADGRH